MMRVRHISLLGCGIVAAGLIASADVNEGNPYRGIVERNPFGLKPPPPPVAPEPAPSPTDKQKVMLTGLFKDHGVQKVCLAIIDSSKNPPGNTYLTMAVGDKDAGVEALEINNKDESARIRFGGQPMLLTVKDNSFKSTAAAAPGAPVVMPNGVPRPFAPVPTLPVPGVNTAPPGFNSAPAGFSAPAAAPLGFNSAPNAGGAGIPPVMAATATYSPVGFGGAAMGAAPVAGAVTMNINGNGQLGATAIPQRTLRTQPTPEPQANGDAAVQYTILAAQKAAAEKRGVAMPPLPPVPGLQ